jgi:thioredoxin-dependent peroxiredoxin
MKLRLALPAAALLALAAPAAATLTPGVRAPDFTAPGAIAGKPVTVSLKAALRKGPVVLYFFPAAYTGGCNAEAHAFAEALGDFTAAGATVIGMTAGNVDQLQKFSAEHCAGKFAVAAASPAIVSGFDVPIKPGVAGTLTSRTSYVIAPDGRIAFVYSDGNPAGHIRQTLAAVKAWRAKHR